MSPSPLADDGTGDTSNPPIKEDEILPVTVDSLPQYEVSPSTVPLSWTAIGIAYLCGAGCIAWATVVLATKRNLTYHTSLSEPGAEMTAFAINTFLTILFDTLGYVHATSLRWALYREGRLAFNTNTRLLTSSSQSKPNSWPVNLAWASCLILCYACTSIILIRGPDRFEDPPVGSSLLPASTCAPGATCVSLNGMSFLMLGIGLLGQATVALLCMWSHRSNIVSWSPNPLNTTLAAMHDGRISRRPHRCMVSVSPKAGSDSGPQSPSRSQPSLWFLRGPRLIVLLLWSLAILTVVWATIVLRVVISQYASCKDEPFSWASRTEFRLQGHRHTSTHCYIVTLGMDPASNSPSARGHFSLASHFVLSILFLCGIQAATTLALHCMEALVNMHRDEHCWRAAATSARGARLATSPLPGFLRSWEALVLFALKTTLHWLLGQSLIPRFGEGPSYTGVAVQFEMAWPRLYVLSGVTAGAALFTTLLALWRPRGYQPACWGNLQTLADLVDEWCDWEGRLWWGEKGVVSPDREVWHAGTCSSRRLDPVCKDKVYS